MYLPLEPIPPIVQVQRGSPRAIATATDRAQRKSALGGPLRTAGPLVAGGASWCVPADAAPGMPAPQGKCEHWKQGETKQSRSKFPMVLSLHRDSIQSQYQSAKSCKMSVWFRSKSAALGATGRGRSERRAFGRNLATPPMVRSQLACKREIDDAEDLG